MTNKGWYAIKLKQTNNFLQDLITLPISSFIYHVRLDNILPLVYFLW